MRCVPRTLNRTWTWTWSGWALCLCASVAVSARHHTGEPVPLLNRGDRAPPGPGAGPSAELLRCNKAAWRIPAHYLVVLRPGSRLSGLQGTIRRLRAQASRRGVPLDVLKTYSGAPRGFLAKMSADVLHMALQLPLVHYIEEDSSIFAQSGAPWNLQRLLQPAGGTSENGTYQPPNDGGMAEVYLMDGGVRASHREIRGRVLVTDFADVPEEGGVRVHRQAAGCEGHGTHVAGVVCGSDSGVAPGAAVKLLHVLNCQGRGTASGALAGLQFIRAALRSGGGGPRTAAAPLVLLPLVAAFSRALNTACRDLVAGGAVVIAAAGNHRDDACLYSPASEPEVITVGAVNAADQLMSQGAGGTNFGRCVDVFAPGDDIVGASSDCNTCFTSRGGTSQAAAHTAGVAAVILSSGRRRRRRSPLQVLHALLRHSVAGAIDFLGLADAHRLATPNRVAAMPPAGAATSDELLCRSVWSGVASADRAVSRCRRGEEMMGCSSFSLDGRHMGESVTLMGERLACVAHAGPAARGVFAVARCCLVAGLRCRVGAGPEPGKDAECEDPQHRLTGCASHLAAEGARPRLGSTKRCAARGGVTSRAICCHAPALECHLVEKTSAHSDQAEASCPSGWTLTDCNAVSQASDLSGPVAEGNGCHILVDGGAVADGAAAIIVIVCCRVRAAGETAATP